MLDPLILRIISVGFAILFIPAAIHKLANISQFTAILRAYKILPKRMTLIASWLIPSLELLLGAAWLLLGIINLPTTVIATMSAMLLGLYTLSIATNISRGRSYIDCGCSFSTTITNTDDDTTMQHLSMGLVVRNILLIIVALVAALPTSVRNFLFIDYFSLLTATIALVLLFGAFNQLLINRNAINTWRKSHG